MDVRVGLWRKAEHGRIDAFEVWCWRRLLSIPWTARRFNQSILKEISPGCPLEVTMLKLKLQYFGHLMRRVDSLENTLMLGEIGGRRRRVDRGWDGWWHHRLDGHEFEQALGVGVRRKARHVAVYGVTKSHTPLSDWTELNVYICSILLILSHENRRRYENIILISNIYFNFYNTFLP